MTAIELLEQKAKDGQPNHYPSMYRSYNYQEVLSLMEEHAQQFIDENMELKRCLDDAGKHINNLEKQTQEILDDIKYGRTER